MREELFTNLLEISSEYESMLLHDGRVYFDLNGLALVFDFDRELFEEIEEYTKLNEIKNLSPKLSHSNPKAVFIYYYDDWGSYSDTEASEHKSITAIMYFLVKKIRELDPNIIASFNTYLDKQGLDEFPDYGLCPPIEPFLAFRIFIHHELLTTGEIFTLLSDFSAKLPRIIKDYKFFKKERNQDALRDDFNLKILHTITKTRRLAYLKLLSTLFDTGKQYPVNRFNQVVEEAAAMVESQLLKHKSNKGLIKKTKSGISAKPYVELALDLDFINHLRGLVVQSKMFKVYSELRKIDTANQNYFELSKLDKLFFLEHILRQDAFYIFTILESLFLYGELSHSALQTIFQESILKKLRKFEAFVKDIGSDKKAKELIIVRNRIEGWGKPQIYLEHVLMPRLNWLFDLEIVSFSPQNTFSLDDKGERLLKHYWDWQDLYGGAVVNPNGILDFAYITIFNDLYEGGKDNPQDEEVIKEKVNAVICDSFERFKTIAPNRVTASQAIAYTQYFLFLKESIITGKPFIHRLLSDEFTERFIYKYQPQYKDGYIQIIKPL